MQKDSHILSHGINIDNKSTTDSSEDVDAFTIEYKKILKQLPSMLKRTEPIPQHLQNYINSHNTSYSSNASSSNTNTSYHRYNKRKKSKSKRKHSRHHHRARHYNTENIHRITIIDDESDDYPPLITDSYFDIKKRRRSKYQIEELNRINEMLSSHNDISTQTETEKESKAIQTDKVRIPQLICTLTKQLNDVKRENESLENEIKIMKKGLIESKLQVSGWKQQIEDQNIYSNNLIKHLDEKSRNEALLRKEMNEQQKQLEAAHFKLQQFLIPNNNKNENEEIGELRQHLMISEQKCLDWKKKWKHQCNRIEQFESQKVMNEHRVDKQLNEYQKIIHDFRNMMKNNLDSVHINFGNLNKENIALKSENERLLFELGTFQENAFKNTFKDDNNNEIHELTQKLNNLQSDLQKSHLNGTMDKSIQCINMENVEVIDDEFNDISIEIYKLMVNLKSKSFDIIHEYGFNSLTNSPNRKNNQRKLYQDTDDVDITSIIINCKKRFHETKEMLKQLLKWFDDVMYHQAEKQCDQCITQ